MNCFVGLIMLGAVATAQLSITDANSQTMASQPASMSASASVDLPALPPAPLGKSTILGGEIRSVDPVRDQLTLRVFGQRPVKILFDERTQVYLDGRAIPLRELRPAEHASVQTLLDRTDIYALSIHMLSRLPEGEYQSRVLNYNPSSLELAVSVGLSRQPIKLLVPANTPVIREDQVAGLSVPSGTSDLAKGALISIRFESDKQGRGVARQITILAAPGSAFVFSGNLSFLDVHSGLLVLIDTRDNKSYKIFFDSAEFPSSLNLHEGDHLKVTANYDGTRYVATALNVD